MAKIKRLILESVKGFSVDEEIPDRVLFVGTNETGKTSRLRAVPLAILGYDPDRGKRPEESLKLSPGGRMAAGVGTDGGFSCARVFSRPEAPEGWEEWENGLKDAEDPAEALQSHPHLLGIYKKPERYVRKMQAFEKKKGEVTTSVLVNGMEAKRVTEGQARIAEILGDFSVMLDLREFLALSDAQKRDFVFRHYRPEEDTWTQEEVEKGLRMRLTELLNSEDVDVAAIAEDLVGRLFHRRESWQSCYEAIPDLLAWLREEAKITRRAKKDAEAAARRLNEEKNRLGTVSPGSIRDLEAEVASLREREKETTAKLAAARERVREIVRRGEKMAQLRQELAKIAAQGTVEESSARMKDLDAQLEALREEKGRVEARGEGISERLRRIGEIDREIEEIRKADPSEEIEPLRREIVALREDKARLSFSGTCPVGIQECEALQERLREADSTGEEIAEVEWRIADMEVRIASAEEAEKAWARQTPLNEEKGRLRKQIDEVPPSITPEELDCQAAAVSAEIDKTAQAIWNLQEKARIQRVLRELEEEDRVDAEEVPDVEEMETLLQSIEAQSKAKEDQLENSRGIQQQLAQISEANLQKQRAEYELRCIEEAIRGLGPLGIQGEICKEIAGPLADQVNDLLREIREDLSFDLRMVDEKGREDFRLGGLKADGTFVPFETMSSGEGALFAAALTVALTVQADPPCKVLIMDDLEKVEYAQSELLAAACSWVKKGYIDNFIGAGVGLWPGTEIPEGLEVRKLERPPAAKAEAA